MPRTHAGVDALRRQAAPACRPRCARTPEHVVSRSRSLDLCRRHGRNRFSEQRRRARVAHLPRSCRGAELHDAIGGHRACANVVRLVVARDAVLALKMDTTSLSAAASRRRSAASTRKAGIVLENNRRTKIASHSKNVWWRNDGPTLSRSLCLPLTRITFCDVVARL